MARKGGDDRTHRIAVDAFAREGAVEVDDVQMRRAGLGEQHRLMRGIVAIDGRAVHIAFRQTHHLPLFQVDRREDDQRCVHGCHARNLSNNASP